MLEMLNPTGGDMLRFAAQILKVRKQLNSAMKADKKQAQALAVDLFCTPPPSARVVPDAARLKADSLRYFGWTNAQWKEQERELGDVLMSARYNSLLHDGHEVQLYQWEPPSGKPLGRILLCHGWEGYAFNFARLIQLARQAGFEVHAFDHLAHGRSQGSLSGLPVALATLLAVAKHVQETSGPIDVLIGHSLGGAAASYAVANGAIPVNRLALIAPFYDTYRLSKQWAMAHLLSDEIRELLQSGLESTSGIRFADFMPDALAVKHAKAGTSVLIIHDKADKITAFKHSAELAQKAANVRLHQVTKLGHIAVLADVESMNKIVQFGLSSKRVQQPAKIRATSRPTPQHAGQ